MTTMAEYARRQRIAAFLYDKGATFHEIADLLEIPHRVAKDAVERRHGARVAVNKALDAGHIAKAIACEECGRTGQRLHAHHHDYADTYNVRWLCPKCHVRIHPGDRTRVTT